MRRRKPSNAPRVLAITAGDPCGVGPEVILKALTRVRVPRRTRLIVIGDHAVFKDTAKRLRRRLPAWQCLSPRPSSTGDRALTFIDCGHSNTFVPGRSSQEAGSASLAYLDLAISLWKAQRISALVTAPVTKWAMDRAHPGFVGQTEYLAGAMGVRDVVMLFVADALRIALLTRHVSLGKVPRLVDRHLLRTTFRLTHDALRRSFNIRRPTLAVCGLNPHAGEGGLFGREERTILLPVMRQLRRDGLLCEGPFAADGFFAQAHAYDAVICWYHDQGLIPFKMVARDRGCQLSVGLPIIRTSPAHGSALEIAGKGMAHPGSTVYAIELATTLTAWRRLPQR